MPAHQFPPLETVAVNLLPEEVIKASAVARTRLGVGGDRVPVPVRGKLPLMMAEPDLRCCCEGFVRINVPCR